MVDIAEGVSSEFDGREASPILHMLQLQLLKPTPQNKAKKSASNFPHQIPKKEANDKTRFKYAGE